jgi:hypothetical protein
MAGVEVPDVLGVGMMLAGAEDESGGGGGGGGSGDGANTVAGPGGEWTPFMLLAAAPPAAPAAVETPPFPLALAVPTVPLLLLALLAPVLPVAAALKEERRFWAEDLRRMVGRREGCCWCESEEEEGGILARFGAEMRTSMLVDRAGQGQRRGRAAVVPLILI